MSTLAANDPRRVAGLSTTTTRMLGVAARALGKRQLAEAESAFVGVLALAPQHPEVLRLFGVLRQLQGRPNEAVVALEAALQARPEDALIYSNLGSAYRSAGQVDAAIVALRHACALAPDTDSVWFNLGRALKGQSLMDEARDSLLRAIACNPANHAARLALAETLKALGDIEASEAMYRSSVGNGPDAAQAWYGLANLKTVQFDERDTASIRKVLVKPGLDAEQQVALGFALAKACEDIGDYAQAYAVLVQANARQRQRVDWNAAAFSASVDAMIQADGLAGSGALPETGSEIIFVMSLPRSGSTLAEQIVAAHPSVEGAGELSHLPDIVAEETQRRGQPLHEWLGLASAADWQRLGEDYLQRTARWRSSKPVSTDKGLNNWFHLAAAVRMLPAARIVLCQREPVETVFSCYRQLFAKGQNFAYDVAEIVDYWNDYQGVARHFATRYPKRIFIQVYESLIRDPETQTRQLLAACGLTFDARCLRFHESDRHVRTASAAQVRQPLQSDTARASRYGSALQPIHDLLGIAKLRG